MTYFSHPFVSNSDLTRLAKELAPTDQIEYSEALRFGTLLHALILEPHKVDLIRLVVNDVQYSRQEIDTARKMKESFMNDSFCRQLLGQSEFEVEMYNEETAFEHNGIRFELPTRRKYDGWIRLTNWGWDLKSTAATSQASFESCVSRLDYDRARVFYAKGPGAIQDCIIGISKHPPYRVFKVFLKHGDPLWLEGERKMNELAFKYYMLKENVVV